MSELIAPLTLLLLVLLPLLCAAAMVFSATHSIALRLAPWVALPVLIQAAFVPQTVSLKLPWLLLGAEFGLVDEMSRLFLLFTALLWWLAGLYAQSYLANHSGRSRFFIYFLLAMSGNFGLILAQDLSSFYLFFTLMSFASYGLVVHERSTEALRAGKIYIMLVVISEVMLFTAMILAATAAGSLEFAAVRHALAQAGSRDLIMLLAFAGFGIKAGVLGLHVWLPLAHPVAPAPASAVLSGAMIKAGLLGWLRLLPLGEVALIPWGEAFILLGLAAAFYGVAVGITQHKPKTLLAYSSISQMGLMTMAVGLGLLNPGAWPLILPTIVYFALHHALSKGALFLGAGLADSNHRLHRWIWVGQWLPALALAGAPWSSGMFAKLLLKANILHAPTPWDMLLPSLLTASSIATALLMARLLYLLRPVRSSVASPVAGLLWPWLAAVLAVLLIPWLLAPSMPAQEGIPALDSLWPILLVSVVSLVVLRAGLFRARNPVPAGDVLVLMECGFQRLSRLGSNWAWVRSVVSTVQQGVKSLWCVSWRIAVKQYQHILDWRSSGVFVAGWSATITLFVLLGLVLAWLAG